MHRQIRHRAPRRHRPYPQHDLRAQRSPSRAASVVSSPASSRVYLIVSHHQADNSQVQKRRALFSYPVTCPGRERDLGGQGPGRFSTDPEQHPLGL